MIHKVLALLNINIGVNWLRPGDAYMRHQPRQSLVQIWTNAVLLSNGPIGTNFIQIVFEIKKCSSVNAYDIFNCIFLNENFWIANDISLKYVPSGLIGNTSPLAQIIAWRRIGDKPLSEPTMVSSTHTHTPGQSVYHARTHFVEFGRETPLFNRDRWFWCSIKHPLFKQSVGLFFVI